MNITKVTLTAEGVFNSNSARLIAVRPWNDFSSKEQMGFIYTLLLEQNNFEKVDVKIEGLTPVIDSENLSGSKEAIYVTFENFVGKFYFSDRTKNYELTCKAQKISIVRPVPLSKSL